MSIRYVRVMHDPDLANIEPPGTGGVQAAFPTLEQAVAAGRGYIADASECELREILITVVDLETMGVTTLLNNGPW